MVKEVAIYDKQESIGHPLTLRVSSAIQLNKIAPGDINIEILDARFEHSLTARRILTANRGEDRNILQS